MKGILTVTFVLADREAAKKAVDVVTNDGLRRVLVSEMAATLESLGIEWEGRSSALIVEDTVS